MPWGKVNCAPGVSTSHQSAVSDLLNDTSSFPPSAVDPPARSAVTFHTERTKHIRSKLGPPHRFTEPSAASQVIGWEALAHPELYAKDVFHPENNPLGAYKPKIKSKETAYAESLILGPRAI